MLLENIADATKGFFNPYHDKRSLARKRTLKRVHKWWEEDTTVIKAFSVQFNLNEIVLFFSVPDQIEQTEPKASLTISQVHERGSSAPGPPRRAVQFEVTFSKTYIIGNRSICLIVFQ